MDNDIVKETIDAVNAVQEDAHEHTCKRCGWDQREDYDVADTEQVKEYFKCIIAQIPFTKSYELFNGLMTVVFEEPTGKLLRLQEKEASKRIAAKDDTISDALDFAVLPALVSVTLSNDGFGSKTLYAADINRRTQIMEKGEIPAELDNMPLVSLQAIRNVYGEFSRLCGQLVRAAQDENFWRGVGRN